MSGAWSCAGCFDSVSVTGDRRQSGTSSNFSDVQRAPSVVGWLFEMRTGGIHAKGEGENQSYLTGVWRETPRFVVWWLE